MECIDVERNVQHCGERVLKRIRIVHSNVKMLLPLVVLFIRLLGRGGRKIHLLGVEALTNASFRLLRLPLIGLRAGPQRGGPHWRKKDECSEISVSSFRRRK